MMDYNSHHELNPNGPLTALDVVRKMIIPSLMIPATVVDVMFIFILIRTRRLLRDKTFAILINLSAVMIYSHMAEVVNVFFPIDSNCYRCYHFYVIRATSLFKFILLVMLLVKSSVSLINSDYCLKITHFLAVLGSVNLLFVIFVIYGFVSKDCSHFTHFNIRMVNVYVYIGFVVIALFHDTLYAMQKGLKEFFLVREIDFMILNFNLTLFIIRGAFYIIMSLSFIPLIYLYLLEMLYVFESEFYFIILYIFSVDFKLCCRQFFGRKKLSAEQAVYKNREIKVKILENSTVRVPQC